MKRSHHGKRHRKHRKGGSLWSDLASKAGQYAQQGLNYVIENPQEAFNKAKQGYEYGKQGYDIASKVYDSYNKSKGKGYSSKRGMGRGRLPKGTAATKAHMAKLRAMRRR
jgi:hypothetical protein